jgi:hypothetical protein
MHEEGNAGRITHNMATMLDYARRSASYRVEQLAPAIVSVHGYADAVRHIEIGLGRRSHRVAVDWISDRRPLQRHQQFARVESELRVQAQRSVVIGGLVESNAGEAFCSSSLHYVQHQLTAHAGVLHPGVDGDRADAGDNRTLVEKVACKNPAAGCGATTE